MTSSLLFLALLSPALVATLAGLETASLELNAHLRVQPALRQTMVLFTLLCMPVGTTPGNLTVNIITGWDV